MYVCMYSGQYLSGDVIYSPDLYDGDNLTMADGRTWTVVHLSLSLSLSVCVSVSVCIYVCVSL